ncbi:hypothetical protein [Streptacidiphilus jiangxiensis]|uniref:Uncharacterized protein n=1 Tax=Streptacidiphilus jiangxiensis TaxID=235985 RepID=A0A1H7V6Q0_STRJI|nr:hypothetical protein [Streptacidiphilus jiangxiensis]SEM04902.1 hypothetical protein SAMN05414137_117125 [Streptacidiphilus jiangxiensis]
MTGALGIGPELKAALVHLRAVKAERPTGADPDLFADWRERIAGCLDALAAVVPDEVDRGRARAEADAVRAQAAEIRRRGEIVSP